MYNLGDKFALYTPGSYNIMSGSEIISDPVKADIISRAGARYYLGPRHIISDRGIIAKKIRGFRSTGLPYLGAIDWVMLADSSSL